MNRIQYSRLARQDLADIKAYITEDLLNPVAAVNVVSKIVKSIRALLTHPLMGALLSSIADVESDYRFLVCGNYVVFYRLENEIIYVSRVMYRRRDFMKILFGEANDKTPGI